MLRIVTKLAFRPTGIYRYFHHVHYACRAISTASKKRIANSKYQTAYSKVTALEAEKRLGLKFVTFERLAISIGQMLEEAKPEITGLRNDQVQQTKEKVFENIVDSIEGEGYPTEADPDFSQANVGDLALLVILPVLAEFRRETGRELFLRREREIITTDSEMGGFQEFVGMDFIGVGDRNFVLVVEAKKSSIGQAKRHCLLALKDMGDKNGGGMVYGFVTSGGQWEMIRYDRMGFTQTERFQILFRRMRHEKEKWMKEGSVIVDCIHTALRSGGLVAA